MGDNENPRKEKSLTEKITDTVVTKDLELPAEIAEFTIDQVLDDGILKDIPIIGWIAKGLSISSSISDRIFYHKVLRFLLSLKKIDIDERNSFLEKMDNDQGYRKRVGEHLIIMLDKIDSIDKTELTAKCFNSFLRGEIDHEYFMDLSAVISRSTLSDLNSLSVPKNKRVYFRSVAIAASSGLLDYGITRNDDDEPDIGHRLSEYGTDLRDVFLGKLPSRYTKKLEQQKRHEEHRESIRQRHAMKASKARNMKAEGLKDDEIMKTLNIDENLLSNYLRKDYA